MWRRTVDPAYTSESVASSRVGVAEKEMVFHTHKVGLTTSACVYILLFYADYAVVYQVIEYGRMPR